MAYSAESTAISAWSSLDRCARMAAAAPNPQRIWLCVKGLITHKWAWRRRRWSAALSLEGFRGRRFFLAVFVVEPCPGASPRTAGVLGTKTRFELTRISVGSKVATRTVILASPRSPIRLIGHGRAANLQRSPSAVARSGSEKGLVTKSISVAYSFTDMRPELIPIAGFVPPQFCTV